jgi:predicted TIM-barrel fold metal-dependent hydrolase
MTPSQRLDAPDAAAPAVVVSCDSHVGPRLREDLREYCPKAYLEQYDAFVAEDLAQRDTMRELFEKTGGARGVAMFDHPNMQTAGHFDAATRLREMDADGVAAEAMWHFSQNGEPMPWLGIGLGTVSPEQWELGSVCYEMYNRWLADFCSADPERLLGLVYLPTWNIDASVAELRRARNAGLKVVNLPACSRPGVLEYNNPAWEPFWSTCEDLGFTLATHSSGGPTFDYMSGTGGVQLQIYEGGGYMSRRAVWWLIYGQVFERHPGIRLVIAEQYEGWYVPTMLELDSIHVTFGMFGDELPRMPSEYMRSNVFLGASFMSTYQATEAWREGYAENVMWGRDYPHIEGTWAPSEDSDAEPNTKLALRHVFSNVPTREALLMAGQNAIGVYGLDAAYMASVADRIGAPTAAELSVPLDKVPDVGHTIAFVGQAGPRPLEPRRLERNARLRA